MLLSRSYFDKKSRLVFFLLLSLAAGIVSVFFADFGFSQLLGILLPTAFFLAYALDVRIFLYMVLFLMPLRDYIATGENILVNLPISLDPGGLINILIIFFCLLYFINNRKNPLRVPIAGFYIVYLIVVGISIFYSPVPEFGLKFLARQISPFCIFLLTADIIIDKAGLQNILAVILLSSVIPIVIGFNQLAGKGLNSRISSSFGHANQYSFYLLLICLVTLPFLLSKKSRDIILYAAFLVGGFTAIIFTGARITFLTLCLTAVLFCLLKRKWKLLVVLFVILTVILILPNPVSQRAGEVYDLIKSQSPDRYNLSQPIGWRLFTWRKLIQQWRERPVFGFGAGSTYPVTEVYSYTPLAPHSGYMRLLYETGLVGLAAFLLVLLRLLWICWRGIKKNTGVFKRNLNIAALLTVFAYIMILFTDSILEYYFISIYYWAVAGAAIAVYRMNPINRGAGI